MYLFRIATLYSVSGYEVIVSAWGRIRLMNTTIGRRIMSLQGHYVFFLSPIQGMISFKPCSKQKRVPTVTEAEYIQLIVNGMDTSVDREFTTYTYSDTQNALCQWRVTWICGHVQGLPEVLSLRTR
jgi:hypothetical protein